MEKQKEKKKNYARGLILFSGGYDSVALLHKLIVSDDFKEITVLYEKSDRLAGEYELTIPKKIFDKFNKNLAEKHQTKLVWVEEQINLDWASNSEQNENGAEICLLLHLSTIMRHGEINNIYIGWEKTTISNRDISKRLLNYFNKIKYEKYNIYFLENYFGGSDMYETKSNVVSYLLENNIFDLPFSSSANPTKEEMKDRKYWFDNNYKERKIAQSLLSIDIFDSYDFSQIFAMKTTKDIQKYYNQKRKQNRIKEKEDENIYK